MLEKLEVCPVCKNNIFENILIGKDFVVTGEIFKIVKCKNCNFKFTNPSPTENLIGRYYQSQEYISHQDRSKNLINQAYYFVKSIALKDKLKLINKFHKKGTLLDLGCGTGSFLDVCLKNDWDVIGVEPDKEARNKAKLKINKEIYPSVFPIGENKKMDVITMWHVLEHVHQIEQTLKKIYNLLNTNGKLIIAVPNVNSFDANLYKEYWAAYDLPRHLFHFSKESLIRLLDNHHFKLLKIEPMKYDAFYISLLSYKYKNNKTNYWDAIKNGYLSNNWARKNDNNYSSLTYIFSK